MVGYEQRCCKTNIYTLHRIRNDEINRATLRDFWVKVQKRKKRERSQKQWKDRIRKALNTNLEEWLPQSRWLTNGIEETANYTVKTWNLYIQLSQKKVHNSKLQKVDVFYWKKKTEYCWFSNIFFHR